MKIKMVIWGSSLFLPSQLQGPDGPTPTWVSHLKMQLRNSSWNKEKQVATQSGCDSKASPHLFWCSAHCPSPKSEGGCGKKGIATQQDSLAQLSLTLPRPWLWSGARDLVSAPFGSDTENFCLLANQLVQG